MSAPNASGVFPVAQGRPSLAEAGYIPIVFSKQFLMVFYAICCLTYMSQTAFSAEIAKYGQKVVVRALPIIPMHEYVIGQGAIYDTPEPSDVELDMNRGVQFGLDINDVEKFQSDLDYMDRWILHGTETQKRYIEYNVFAETYADADATNQGATAGAKSGNINLGATGGAVSIGKTNVVNFITKMAQCLNENDVPMDEAKEYAVIPMWMANLLQNSELKATFLTGDKESPIRKQVGYIGTVGGLRLHASNLLTVDSGGTHVIFGHSYALTYANQIARRDNLINPFDFGQLVRSLNVFGFKVIKPTAFGHAYVTLNTSDM
jgi:hypothetical protein